MLDGFSSCDHLHLTDDLLHSTELGSIILYEEVIQLLQIEIAARVCIIANVYKFSKTLKIKYLHQANYLCRLETLNYTNKMSSGKLTN